MLSQTFSQSEIYTDCLKRYVAYYNDHRDNRDFYHLKDFYILDQNPILNFLPKEISGLRINSIKFNDIDKVTKKRGENSKAKGSERFLTICNISDITQTNENLLIIEIIENSYFYYKTNSSNKFSFNYSKTEHVQISYAFNCDSNKYIFSGLEDINRNIQQFPVSPNFQDGKTLYTVSISVFLDSIRHILPDKIKSISLIENDIFKNSILHYSIPDTIEKNEIKLLNSEEIGQLNRVKRTYYIGEIFVNEESGFLNYNIRYYKRYCKSPYKLKSKLLFEADNYFKYDCMNKKYVFLKNIWKKY